MRSAGDDWISTLHWTDASVNLRARTLPYPWYPGPEPAWQTAPLVDVTQDGESDLLWQHDDGWLGVWVIRRGRAVDNRSVQPDRLADPRWRLRGSGDFDRDGVQDLVWQHPDDGRVAIWYMSPGATLRSAELLGPGAVADTRWHLRGVADLNADGWPDLVWQHDDGWLGAWLMRASELIDATSLTPSLVSDSRWQVIGVADADGDGWPDLYWRHADGWLAVWLMRGTSYLESRMLWPEKEPVECSGCNVVVGR